MNMPLNTEKQVQQIDEIAQLSQLLAQQKSSYRSQPDPAYSQRVTQLNALKSALLDFQQPRLRSA